jgi:hypothetical protein
MNDDRLTEKLAAMVLGWKTAPGRFIKPDRGWTPRWHFAPLTKIEDAFLLLDRIAKHYTLTTDEGEGFRAEVYVGVRVGRASGERGARTVTLALARALGLEVDS